MKNKLFIVYKKELREILRDKKSLSMMLIIPLMIPLIIIGMSKLFDTEVNKQVNEYNKVGFTYSLSPIEKKIINEMNINKKTGSKKDIKKLLKNEEINIFIEKEGNNYIINYDQNKEESSSSVLLAEKYLEIYKTYLQEQYLTTNNINKEDVINIINVSHKEIGNKEENFYANYITTYSFLFIIMAITISSTYPATDTTAGEKERGTMETLLTFPIRKKDIILGKYLGVATTSIITGILSFILSLISLKISENKFEIYKNLTLVPSLETIIISVIIIVLFSFLISGMCISVASKSKTFKEAQSKLTPISFIAFFPGLISFMLNIKTTAFIAIIPFLNYIQIFNDINSNKINTINILLMIISTIIYIAVTMYIIIKQYKNEKILFN